MQNIPSLNDYRNCFIPNYKDWVFVSSDYSSQELALIAHESQDEIWLNALKENKDLHSICAELLFGNKWKDSAESNCQYYVNQKKCNCKEHKKLRTFAKNLNFMLAYGGGAHKLADKMEISIPEATKFFQVGFSFKNFQANK
jgi:DNA polymerase-1